MIPPTLSSTDAGGDFHLKNTRPGRLSVGGSGNRRQGADRGARRNRDADHCRCGVVHGEDNLVGSNSGGISDGISNPSPGAVAGFIEGPHLESV